MLLVTSVNVIDNIIKRFNPNFTESRMVFISRVCLVVTGILATILGIFGSSIVGVMQDVTAPYTSAILPLIVAGFFWKKATPKAAWATIIVAVITSCGWWMAGQPWGIHHIVVSLLCSTFAMIVVSILTYNSTNQA